MFNGVSGRLCIKRIGVFGDGAVLACAMEESTKKTGLFIILGDGNKCYFKTGSSRQWQRLNKHSAEIALQSICQAVTQGLEVFDINGNSDHIINRNILKGGNMFTKTARFAAAMALVTAMTIVSMPIGTAHAESLHWGQRQQENIMPASPVHTGAVAGNGQDLDALIVAGGKAHTGLVVKARHDDAAVAEETGSDLSDEARGRIYDGNGNFIGWQEVDIVRDDAGRIIKQTTVTFDKDGHRINSSTKTFEYTLDDKGNVASVKVTRTKDGKVVWTAEHTFTRDENGKVTERTATFKDANGKVMFTAVQTYTRDDNGRITESTIERKDAKGKLLSKDSIKYTYGEDGKIKERTLTRTNAQGKTIFESTRTFKDGVLQKDLIKRFNEKGDLVRKEIVNYH